jgi:sulfite reductase (ferredoxin)
VSTPEEIKLASRHLRGTLATELDDAAAPFEHDAIVLLKFHGIYQQDDRDSRRVRTQAKEQLDYSSMVRAAVPGGRISLEQWRALDRLADVANGSMRLTTRQGVQYHVVRKGDLRDLVHDINDAALTTLAACGDVVRNVMACPFPDERQQILEPATAAIVDRFRPQTTAYWELWVNGDKAVTAHPAAPGMEAIASFPAVDAAIAGTDERPRTAAPAAHQASSQVAPRHASEGQEPEASHETEPVYGDTYLPRKFKIALAWPGDNCVDVYANDVGLIPTLSEGTTGELTGWVVVAGGGMGASHARPEDTYPRLATPLCWATPDEMVDVVEAVVTAQRDFGNREDRQRARLKYTIDERSIGWLREEVERRVGHGLADPVELPPFRTDDHHGCVHQSDGTATIGLPVPSGRVLDSETMRIRTLMTSLIDDGLITEVRVTARQDLLLVGVAADQVDTVHARIRSHGLPLATDITGLHRLAIACPALPTCGQALGEAERVLPDLIGDLDAQFVRLGLGDLPVRLNMTGCPNGCARPYNAEIGIVGRTKKNYDVFVGGSPGGDRMATLLRADVPLADITALLTPVLDQFADQRHHDESFGDWTDRTGIDALQTLLPAPTSRRRVASA